MPREAKGGRWNVRRCRNCPEKMAQRADLCRACLRAAGLFVTCLDRDAENVRRQAAKRERRRRAVDPALPEKFVEVDGVSYLVAFDGSFNGSVGISL